MESIDQPKVSQDENFLSWSALEYHYYEKSTDWYWAVGFVTFSISVSAFIFNNVLFGILIIIGAIALLLHAVKRPLLVDFEVTTKGINIGNERYPFRELKSFWIASDNEEDKKLILQSKKMLSQYIVIPLGDMDEDILREFLENYLPEEEHHEQLSHKFMEYLGF